MRLGIARKLGYDAGGKPNFALPVLDERVPRDGRTNPELKGRRLLPSAEIFQVSAGVGGLARAGERAR